VNAARFDWLTMGMLRDKVTALFKTLPQKIRSQIVPVPDTVSEFIGHITKREGMNDLSAAEISLIDAMAAFLREEKRIDAPMDAWDVSRLPPHLLMNFRIVDADGKELAMSRDFAALKAQFADASRTVFSTLHKNRLERGGITKWDFDALPETINFERNQIRYDGFPALVDCDTSVSIKIFDQLQVAKHSHRRGLTRLFMLEMAEQAKFLERGIKLSPIAAFQFAHYFPESKNHTQDAMKTELVYAAFAGTMVESIEAEIRDEATFSAARVAGKAKLAGSVQALMQAMEESFTASAEIRKLLGERYVKSWEHIGPEIEEQLQHLFEPDFLREVPMAQLLHFPRYLKGIVLRLNKARLGSMERDIEHARSIRPLWQNALKLQDWLEPKAAEYRWMIEELRVSLFAQELRTLYPASVKRVTKAWEELAKQK
jgi:ATP-dependent helicase HrpA